MPPNDAIAIMAADVGAGVRKDVILVGEEDTFLTYPLALRPVEMSKLAQTPIFASNGTTRGRALDVDYKTRAAYMQAELAVKWLNEQREGSSECPKLNLHRVKRFEVTRNLAGKKKNEGSRYMHVALICIVLDMLIGFMFVSLL